MSRHRYHFVLIEEPQALPVLRRSMPRPGPGFRVTPPIDAMVALLEAFAALHRRGAGPEAWAPPLSSNPLAFLLDAIDDAVFVRGHDGRVMFRNRAAQRRELAGQELAPDITSYAEIAIAGRVYHRRCMSFGSGDRQLVLEVFTERPTEE